MKFFLIMGIVFFLSLVNTPPKRGAEVILPTPSPVPSDTDYKTEECQAELRLLDEETLQANDNDTKSKSNPKTGGHGSSNPQLSIVNNPSFKCQIVMAILAILALIPLICIVIYLVGMFWKVPSTLSMTSS